MNMWFSLFLAIQEVPRPKKKQKDFFFRKSVKMNKVTKNHNIHFLTFVKKNLFVFFFEKRENEYVVNV